MNGRALLPNQPINPTGLSCTTRREALCAGGLLAARSAA